jgi:HEAT repeat protein
VRKLLGLVVLLIATSPLRAAGVEDLIKSLSSSDNEIRRKAAEELRDLGKEAKPAVKALTKALKDPDRFVKRFSAQALGNIGDDAKDSIPELAKLLEDGNQSVREAAVKAIGKMGSAGIPALTKALAGASDVQEHAINGLATAGPSAVPSLALAIKNVKIDASLRRKAIAGVVALGDDGKGALAALTETVKSPKGIGRELNQMRLDAIAALGTLATKEDKAAVKVLDDIAKDEKIRNNQLKNAVKQALKKIQSKS